MIAISRPRAFYLGVFLTTLCTLVHQVTTTRIFSVITWYHLAFLAISLAMLGMTAAGLFVYLRGTPDGEGERETDSRRLLITNACLLAVSLPLSHVLMLEISERGEFALDAAGIAVLIGAVVITGAPFFFSGIVVAVALTRTTLPLGRVYGVDLLGAAIGCLAAIALLEWTDPSTVCAISGAVAAIGAVSFSLGVDGRLRVIPLGLAGIMLALSFANMAMYPDLMFVSRMKGHDLEKSLYFDQWNSHSRVVGFRLGSKPPFYWGRGTNPSAPSPPYVQAVGIQIDGAAFTPSTSFGGDTSKLDWVGRDVTSIPYRLRGRGKVGVIGVGGGRDILTALGSGTEHVTGIEVNGILIDLLNNRLRSFAGLADREDVRLVHDDGRSWMTRTEDRFDLIQMSLIDTFASTSAGAMTLTENGLYTLEAWGMFLDRLRPGGIFSVSRYYNPDRVSETARAVSLAVATLIDRGAANPAAHIVLVTSRGVSTLLLGVEPLTAEDVRKVVQTAKDEGFQLQIVPGRLPNDPILNAILGATNFAELELATRHPVYQLEPSTDDKPFFFNMLKFSAWRHVDAELSNTGVIVGNLVATQTLMALLVIVFGLIAVTILVPLAIRGRGHGLNSSNFIAATTYFGLIGLGFMLIEVGLMQKFSILLGHPIHSLAVTLMSIILASGVGSLVSDRIRIETHAVIRTLPIAAGLLIIAAAVSSQTAIDIFISAGLPIRVATVVAFSFPIAFVLGFFFPIGMRLLGETNPAAQSWMWGLNGALGVMGTLASIVIAMTMGIRACLLAGAICYLLLVIPMFVLSRGGTRQAT